MPFNFEPPKSNKKQGGIYKRPAFAQKELRPCGLIIGAANHKKAEKYFNEFVSEYRSLIEEILISSAISTPNSLWNHIRSYLREADSHLNKEELIQFGVQWGKMLEHLNALILRSGLDSHTAHIIKKLRDSAVETVEKIENAYLRG